MEVLVLEVQFRFKGQISCRAECLNIYCSQKGEGTGERESERGRDGLNPESEIDREIDCAAGTTNKDALTHLEISCVQLICDPSSSVIQASYEVWHVSSCGIYSSGLDFRLWTFLPRW